MRFDDYMFDTLSKSTWRQRPVLMNGLIADLHQWSLHWVETDRTWEIVHFHEPTTVMYMEGLPKNWNVVCLG